VVDTKRIETRSPAARVRAALVSSPRSNHGEATDGRCTSVTLVVSVPVELFTTSEIVTLSDAAGLARVRTVVAWLVLLSVYSPRLTDVTSQR
jgi:hypothetical protein